MYGPIAEKLKTGAAIVIDGGTGTDIQRRGVPMDGDTWCAEANRSHPEIVRQVHADYIAAGADVIIANTFATSPLLFNALGRDDDLLAIDREAVALARAAAAGSKVAVAGSISTMRPLVKGSDRNNLAVEWPKDEACRLFARKANNLAAAGVDLLALEMLRDGDYAVLATEAAVATGIPVWAGVSCERNEKGELVGWGRADWRFEDLLQRIIAARPHVINVMHTSPNDTDEALAIVRRHWDGPVGTYPESGYFRMPDWVFVDIIAPDALVAKSRDWRKAGASLFGGCCGIGPAHIEALAKEFKG
ncbi:MAG: homocysteine S-methyltransferase family protein [Alphaproteobacteria bacterium]|nr:homocysteine S-methyltransferase family protein [Alphaproteobacteria bacterium]